MYLITLKSIEVKGENSSFFDNIIPWEAYRKCFSGIFINRKFNDDLGTIVSGNNAEF